jgi:hypothetical protein
MSIQFASQRFCVSSVSRQHQKPHRVHRSSQRRECPSRGRHSSSSAPGSVTIEGNDGKRFAQCRLISQPRQSRAADSNIARASWPSVAIPRLPPPFVSPMAHCHCIALPRAQGLTNACACPCRHRHRGAESHSRRRLRVCACSQSAGSSRCVECGRWALQWPQQCERPGTEKAWRRVPTYTDRG